MESFGLLLVFCTLASTLANTVQSPVYLWGIDSDAKPSLISVTKNELINILEPKLQNKSLIVFLEETLNNKDFLCEFDQETCLVGLQNVFPRNFYASVQDPVQTLKSLQVAQETLNFNESNYLDRLNQLLQQNKIIFVNLNNHTTSNEFSNRVAVLKSHDFTMGEIYNEFKERAFFIYTTEVFNKPGTKTRQRRDVSSSGFKFRDGANLLLYFQSIIYKSDNIKTDITVTKMVVNFDNETSLSVQLMNNSSKNFTFNINLKQGYFSMENLQYGDAKFYISDVSAPTSFSYYCSNLTLRNNNSSDFLIWNGLQFQAPFGATKDENFKFGDPWHCVGFVSSAILMGLLIVTFLLSILFTGLCWIKDINTMDRFDDPKGKTITINSNE